MESRITSKPTTINTRRSPKSRTGCVRCKAKRLKCDEGKPHCHQCVRRQLACPGYKTKLVWSTKHEKISTSKPNVTHAAAIPTSQLLSQRDIADVQQLETSSPEEVSPAEIPVGVSNNLTFNFELASSENANRNPLLNLTHMRSRSNQFPDSLSAIRHQLENASVPQFMQHLPTMLVEHYFNYVCQIFSSFDGTLNPFRSTVGRLWDASAPIYYAIQSMAAAYLANHFPRMGPVGIEMQREAYKCLYQATSGLNQDDLDKRLLSVLLVGQTTAWHNPKDLGLVHLRTAKRLNQRRIEQQSICDDGRVKRQNEFFEQCILYWDMLSGFVIDDVNDSVGEPPRQAASDLVLEDAGEARNVFPHPWTGVAPKVQRIFARVGKIVRAYRKTVAADRASSLDFLSFVTGLDGFPESAAAIELKQSAQILEEELLTFQPPPVSNLVDAGDENTPIQQYIFLAEAYRCAGFLVLYRVFPSILINRLPAVDDILTSSPNPTSSHNSLDCLSISTSQAPGDFLVSLAVHTITLLEKLPSNSGTRCLQPLILIVAASELRFSPPHHDGFNSAFPSFDTTTTTSGCLDSKELGIASARRFVKQRLQDFELSLPAKPIVNASTLVRETWTRMDNGLEVFWMDVMEELGLESIFG